MGQESKAALLLLLLLVQISLCWQLSNHLFVQPRLTSRCLTRMVAVQTRLRSMRTSEAPTEPLARTETLPASRLIELTKKFLDQGTGYYSPVCPALLAEDFVFRGGVVGPLNKEDYCQTMTRLGISDAFRLEANAFGFTVDPSDPLCVRFFLRNTGEQVSAWQPWGAVPPIPIQPTAGRTKIVGPTETARLVFNPHGQIKHFATGLVVGKYEAQQADCNTNSIGAVLGLFHALGFGFVGEIAFNAVVRDLANTISDRFDALRIPKTKTKDEEVPSWWIE